jgi:phosphocarrier protein HPr
LHPLRRLEIVVQNPSGLHARPLSKVVSIVEACQKPAYLVYNGSRCCASSILDMLSLCIPCGAQVVFEVELVDEAALNRLKALNDEGTL